MHLRQLRLEAAAKYFEPVCGIGRGYVEAYTMKSSETGDLLAFVALTSTDLSLHQDAGLRQS